jgi:hypothetical protein
MDEESKKKTITALDLVKKAKNEVSKKKSKANQTELQRVEGGYI